MVFLGLPGLVGTNCSVIPILVGMCCASVMVEWSDARMEVFQRRIQLVVYIILAFLFFLILVCLERSVRIAIWSAWGYGFLYGFAVGPKAGEQKSFHKLGKFFATLTLITVSMLLITGIIFYKKTVV